MLCCEMTCRKNSFRLTPIHWPQLLEKWNHSVFALMPDELTDRWSQTVRKVLPLHELLQKFHEASYITSMDLSRAFLQVLLKTDSRTWTAFQFQGKVYQYKTSIWVQEQLSRIYSGFGKGLGDDKINNHFVMYVDDLVHSSTFWTFKLWCKNWRVEPGFDARHEEKQGKSAAERMKALIKTST